MRHAGPTVRAALGSLALLAMAAVACDAEGAATPTPEAPPATVTASAATPAATATPSPTPTPEPLPPSTEWTWLVSKEHALPDGYAPDDLVTLPPEWRAPTGYAFSLRREPAEAAVEMLEAMRDAGLTAGVLSAYRSYDQQVAAHESLAARVGPELAARRSAPPGRSEHQLGSTLDFSTPSVGWEITADFDATPESAWLREHAHEYGFALSYPPDGETVTGYVFEPWHYRYVGDDHARRWKDSGLTLIEYLRLVEGASAPGEPREGDPLDASTPPD
ncbi:MAG: M15 family metallopeptidase [Dehalococcoidia bacterium]